MRVFGAAELTKEVQDGGLCIGCGACVELCPYFRNHRGRTVQLFSCNLPKGRCYAACPKAEVDLDELARANWGEAYRGLPMGRYENALAAKAGPKMAPGAYQGGGVVSALLVHALDQGFAEAAVLTGQDEAGPLPVVAEGAAEILACASSKFGAAPSLAALNRAAGAGRRNLAVVGTPCQVTAVAKMRLNPLKREDFADPVSLVIGVFCNWALDQRGLRAFLARRVDLSKVKGMDIPPPPANILRVDLGDTVIEVPLDEVRPFIPPTCSFCPDMTAEWADVSVGMFEGRPGWNTLVVRSERGRRLVESARSAGMLVTEEMPEANLGHLAEAAGAKKRRAFQAASQRGLVNPTDREARAVLRLPADILEAILGAQNGGNHV